MRNPFARRASRIPRLLLLHPREAFTIQGLARLARVDTSLVSRTVAALAAAGHVRVEPGSTDERRRNVRLSAARELLEDWKHARRKKELLTRRFDIGTKNVRETLRVIKDSARPGLPYAVSGLAGAQFVQRVVEPADVLLLAPAEQVGAWAEHLLAQPAEGGRGLLRILPVDDVFVFDLAEDHQNLRVADPVQLWLDSASSGERASVATGAIEKAMGW